MACGRFARLRSPGAGASASGTAGQLPARCPPGWFDRTAGGAVMCRAATSGRRPACRDLAPPHPHEHHPPGNEPRRSRMGSTGSSTSRHRLFDPDQYAHDTEGERLAREFISRSRPSCSRCWTHRVRTTISAAHRPSWTTLLTSLDRASSPAQEGPSPTAPIRAPRQPGTALLRRNRPSDHMWERRLTKPSPRTHCSA